MFKRVAILGLSILAVAFGAYTMRPIGMDEAQAATIRGAGNCHCQSTASCAGSGTGCSGDFIGCIGKDNTNYNCNVGQSYCGSGGTCSYFVASGPNSPC